MNSLMLNELGARNSETYTDNKCGPHTKHMSSSCYNHIGSFQVKMLIESPPEYEPLVNDGWENHKSGESYD